MACSCPGVIGMQAVYQRPDSGGTYRARSSDRWRGGPLPRNYRDLFLRRWTRKNTSTPAVAAVFTALARQVFHSLPHPSVAPDDGIDPRVGTRMTDSR